MKTLLSSLFCAALLPVLPMSARAAGASSLGSTCYDWSALTAVRTPVGWFRRVADAPTPTVERLEVHVTTLLPGYVSHPPHHHPQEELVLLKEGTLESSINGRKQTIGAGSLLFFASHDVHNVTNVGRTPATYYVINFYTPATYTVRDEAAAKWAPAGLQPSSVIDWRNLVPSPMEGGSRRRLIDAPTLTYRRLRIYADTLQPGGSVPSERCACARLLIVKEGCLDARIDGVTDLAGPGSVILVAAGSRFSLGNAGAVPMTYFDFSVGSSGAAGT